jgi:hypothetical protein
MTKHRITSPSRYFERQSPAQAPIVMEYVKPDYEAWAMILGAAVWGFALGMVVVAGWAGVL